MAAVLPSSLHIGQVLDDDAWELVAQPHTTSALIEALARASMQARRQDLLIGIGTITAAQSHTSACAAPPARCCLGRPWRGTRSRPTARSSASSP